MKLWNKFATKRAENTAISGGRNKRPQNRPNTPQVLSDVHNSATQGEKLQAGAAVCGRSMVEMLGVLAIIGVLSVGGIAGYQKAMFKYKLNKFMDQMTNIIANIRTAYGTQKTVEGLNNANIKKLGLVPDDMYKTANSNYPEHFWGGTIYFGRAYMYDSNTMSRPMAVDNMFYISMNYIPKDVCISVLTADWGADLAGIGAANMGSSPTPPDYGPAKARLAIPGDKDYPAPYSMTRAEQQCSETKNMTLYWYFKL